MTENLARRTVGEVAPDELELFPLTASAYFANPGKAINAATSRSDEMLGSGLELAEAAPVISTAALCVANDVVAWVGAKAREAAEEKATSWLKQWAHWGLEKIGLRQAPDPSELPQLTQAQLRQIHALALRRAELVPEDAARVVADSILAGLVLELDNNEHRR